MSASATVRLKLSKNYDPLTGNQAYDIVKVAHAQEGNKGRDMGVYEYWCADFVFSCAREAGISEKLIPSNGSCTQMKRIMLQNGAKEVKDPRAGDLVFYGNEHVGIVEFSRGGVTVIIEGNAGKPDDVPNNKVVESDAYKSGWIPTTGIQFIRPNYSGASIAPITVTFDANGGKGGPGVQKRRENGTDYPIPLETPTRDGYVFAGWLKKGQYDSGHYSQPGDLTYVDFNTTFVAKWKRYSGTLTYDLMGGTGDFEPVDIMDGGIELPEYTPEKENSVFMGWSTSPEAVSPEYLAGDTFASSDSATLYAVWRESKEDVFYVTTYYYEGCPANTCEAIPKGEYGSAQYIAKEPAATKRGYVFAGWREYTGYYGSRLYQPGSYITINRDTRLVAYWTEDTTNSFYDVSGKDYFYDPVMWAVKEGVTSGTSATTFSPNKPCTRAEAVTFLWRAAGKPAPSSQSSFTDVKSGQYYSTAVSWAVEQGITSGTGGGKFSPNDKCSRAQIVTFLWRAASKPTAEGSGFTDVSSKDYYHTAVQWASDSKITSGVGDGKFDPNASCTRAQIVSFLYRYHSK